MLKFLKRLLIVAVVVYVGLCAAVYYYPHLFFYNPTHKASNINNAHANGYKAEIVKYYASDGTALEAWYTKPGAMRKVIVFMHGNSYNVENFYHKMIPFVNAGYGTLMPEYRGFGNVSGEIKQENLEKDALAAITYLHSKGFKNKDIIVYGMSLGSHMAVNSVYQNQSQGNFDALILEVPFTSLEDTLRAIVPVYMPWKFILKDKYENTEMLSKIKCPVLILGGSEDQTVPVELARNLYTYSNEPRKIIVYEGAAHNNLYNFKNYADILEWLKQD